MSVMPCVAAGFEDFVANSLLFCSGNSNAVLQTLEARGTGHRLGHVSRFLLAVGQASV